MTSRSNAPLAEVSSSAVTDEPAIWREALRDHQTVLSALGRDEQTRILREFLSACVQSGPGAVDHREARNILETITFLLKNEAIDPRSLLSLAELTGQVLRRADLDPKLEVIAELTSFLSSGPVGSETAPTVPGLSAAPTTSGVGIPAELADLIDRKTDGDALDLKDLSRNWFWSARTRFDVETQTKIDLFLLRTAITTRSSVAVEFVHELYSNDAFWATALVQDWCTNLGTPISSEGLGEVCAAMINTRLRNIVPRTFLKHPDAMVVDAIARGDEIKRIETGLREEFAVQIMLALFRVNEALSPERPLKRPLLDLRKSFENALTRYATRLIGEVGTIVAYDPDIHLSANPLVKGDDVQVVQSGLRSMETGFVIQPIKVIPVANRTTEEVLGT